MLSDDDLLDQQPAELLGHWRLPADVRVELAPTQGHSSQTWLLSTDRHRYVAKLIRDQRRYVEPGLRVAAAVDAGGVPTGAPVPTRNGEFCVDVPGDGYAWTLALLRYVPGARLKRTAERAPELAGDLLGRVHSILLRESVRAWVPADLIEWCERHAATLADADRGRAARALAVVRSMDRRQMLTCCVIYGDPCPEVLVDERSHRLGLIDWGTPSWGPLLHDIACWTAFYGADSEDDAFAAFVAAYQRSMPLSDDELRSLPHFRDLADALGLTSGRRR
jgi:Ser/Thr protein kinase RdoA (MazF antagonist)